ncbi:MAG: hypothetical protein KDK97_21360, partial [Verrucomicrobiales bacterium]|nr:hypothetical protein [Verrucomicrobiales bacterium]
MPDASAEVMRAVLIPLLALPAFFTVPSHAAGEGLYKLEALSGSGSRSWQLTALLDGIPCSDHGNITLTDTMTGPGELILKADGTAEAKWKHRVTLTYDYQPDYYQPRPWVPLNGTETCPLHTENAWLDQNYYPYIGGDAPPRPRNKLVVEFDTQATGTWGGAVTLNLTCTSTCNVTASYKPENSTQLTVENFMATLNNVNVTATASGGAMTFEVDMLKTFVQALANQHLTGDRYLSAEDSLRNGKDRVVPNYSPCDGFPGGSGDEFVDKVVKTWTYKGTQLSFSPTSGNMDAKYTQYYLLNVNAPFGFYAQGNYGTASGLQEARFRYGSSTFQTSIESGYAEASSFDYGDAATAIDVDILSDGAVALTLNKPLIKVPVSPWAAPAGAWNASAGVRYRRSPLHWPISMSATRSLASASILTGLWGISGSASSTFDVSAHSQGTPQKGNLTANIQFKVAKKQLGFSLSGKHQTTLNGSGLTATGRFSSSPLGAKWQQRASLLSLVPGANAALSALGPFGARLVGGAGVSVEAGVKGTLSGEYQATPGDATPLFTSGSLT